MVRDRAHSCRLHARPGVLLPGVLAALLVFSSAGTARAAKAGSPFGGEADLEAFHTTDLFPGGDVSEPDYGVRLILRPEWRGRVGHGLRARGWVSLIAERYHDWPDRNLNRWGLGFDLKRGPHRLRAYAGTTPDELYFPSSAGGAFLNRAQAGLEARVGLGPGWFAHGGFEYERENFVPNYDTRDDHRSTWTLGGAREFGAGRRLELSYRFRRQDSVTNLYTYGQNLARLDAEWTAAPIVAAETRIEYALRDYRTGIVYAPNFGREDDRWRVFARLHRPVVHPLEVEVFGEWRQSQSTRLSKNYSVSTVGLGVSVSR